MKRIIALSVALALLASSCTSSGDRSVGTTVIDTEPNPAAADASSTTLLVNRTTGAPKAGEPDLGGRLVYGVEADSANPWAHYRTSCGLSCFVVLQTVSDPLFVQLDDGEIDGMLVERFEANENFTVHTWTIRDQVSFHDGSPLDAAAVAFNIDACRFSPLTGTDFASIIDVRAEGQVVTITTNAPWVPLTARFAQSPCAFMLSPTWLSTLPDIPFREDGTPHYSEQIAAQPADGDPAAPVGVGAFRFESFVAGNGNSFIASRNDQYWRGPTGLTGERLPYLDQVEIVVTAGPGARLAAIQSGRFDIIHTSNPDSIRSVTEDGSLQLIASNAFSETNYIMFNTGQGENPTFGLLQGLDGPAPMDPTAVNVGNPLLHESCRRALAHATDVERVAEQRGSGVTDPANGPFPPGSIGHTEDSGYPQFDLGLAAESFQRCQLDVGSEVISFELSMPNEPFVIETYQLIASMWGDAFGDQIDVSFVPIDLARYGAAALTGSFDAMAWNNHGGTDPDLQFLWWYSGTASPIGSLALNFGRFQDPVIDENLVIQRQVADSDLRRTAAEAINRAFGEHVWNLWLTWTTWGIIANDQVRDPAPRSLVAGRHEIAQIWCEGGVCGD